MRHRHIITASIRWVLSWPGRFEFPALILVTVTAAGLWGFVQLTEEVFEGDTVSFDERILLALRNPSDHSDPLGPGWIEEAGRDFSALGGVAVLSLLTVGVCLFLWLQKKSHAAVMVVASVGTGIILSTLLKFGFDRPRPDLVSHGSIVYTASFPSGHSMMSAVTYLTLGALLARTQPNFRLKAFALLMATLLTVLVGISRVYLGVHWPTDVFAGWTAGATWASACWLVVRFLQRRGKVENADETEEDLAALG